MFQHNYKYVFIILIILISFCVASIFTAKYVYSEDSELNETADSYESLLSLDLVDFRIKEINDSINIIWTTLSENQNQHFEVERSNNGLEFFTISKISNTNNKDKILDYVVIDKDKPHKFAYYRLKQISERGKIDYSEIISFQPSSQISDSGIIVNPNPCIGKCNITLQNSYNNNNIYSKIDIYDIVGNVIHTALPNKIMKGKSEIIFDSKNYLNSAVYVIRGTMKEDSSKIKLSL